MKPFISKDEAIKITDNLLSELWLKFETYIKSTNNTNYKYFKSLSLPVIVWKKFGYLVAGRAHIGINKIEMNENYLYSPDYKKFISNTFKHELAHILAYEIFDEDNHKTYWKIIDKLFGDDGNPYHDYKFPLNKPKQKNKIEIKCKAGCQHTVTLKMFEKFKSGDYTCFYCKHNMNEAKKVVA